MVLPGATVDRVEGLIVIQGTCGTELGHGGSGPGGSGRRRRGGAERGFEPRYGPTASYAQSGTEIGDGRQGRGGGAGEQGQEEREREEEE
eukprot:3734949-Rhodomonas_salina.1